MTDTASFSIPQLQVIDIPVPVKKHPLVRMWQMFESLNPGIAGATSRRGKGVILNKKNLLPIGFSLLAVLLLISFVVRKTNSNSQPQVAGNTSNQVIKDARTAMTINQVFDFPIMDKGKEVTRFKYTVESAELRDQIIVQGRSMSAIEGKTFLIVAIKIQNDFNKAINVNARDYIRLTVNGNSGEQIAADIHNDTVNIQPISTKTTRIGFPVNRTDTGMSLIVGEIEGEKNTITLEL